jgi:hypothetical protein
MRLGNPQETSRSSRGILRGHTLGIREEHAVQLSADWVVGFVDGEGCFHVSVNRQPAMVMGFQVLPEFVVVQHSSDRQILMALKRFFGAGVVRSNHGDRDCLRIRKIEALQNVCDFFLKHPLKTKKNTEFRKFRRIVMLMSQERHLDLEGLKEIVQIALQMNSVKRPALQVVWQELVSRG